MTRSTHPSVSPVLGLLALLTACRVDCPEGQVPISDRQGTRQVCVNESETSSGSESTGTTTAAVDTTSEDSPCDDDPACGPDEDVTRCPNQCNVCGDGVVFGDEVCDNGADNRTYWPGAVSDDACSKDCNLTFHRCGDAVVDADEGEACDNGKNNDPAYVVTQPVGDACAPGCHIVRFCGDTVVEGDEGEVCDNGPQNQSYWPEPPPARACSGVCGVAFEWCGDGIKNGPEVCDNGSNADPPYTPFIPAVIDPCALGCTPVSFCGDDALDAEQGEACDDGNNDDGDGCSADCKQTERLVFISGALFKGDFNQAQDNPKQLTGLALADARCNSAAASAGFTGNFKAWLSDSVEAPATRFDTQFTGLYRLPSPDHSVVAVGWSGLVTKPLLHPIDADEAGAAASGELVWTNTLVDGTRASDLHCIDWSSSKGADTTKVGDSSKTDPNWTDLVASSCAAISRLYCFEDPS